MLKEKASNSESVKCVIRCRPLNAKEMAENNEVVVSIKGKTGEIFVSKTGSDEAPKQFTFDEVFDWNSRQVDIY